MAERGNDPTPARGAGPAEQWLARIAWCVPLLLVLLAGNQAYVGTALKATLADGEPATAEVTHYEKSDRADVTYGYVDLRVATADGVIEREKLSLPYSLMHRIEGAETLEVRVLRGTSQEIVITEIARAQWRMALIQGVMALVAALMAVVGVRAWNRWIARRPAAAAAYPRGSDG